MLIGAHVSQAGGLPNAIQRGSALNAHAIQIFNQSPRMWRPTAYSDDDFAAFREAMSPSAIKAVLIHAVYLINCASEDSEIRQKVTASLVQSLTVGAGIGASGVVLHSGSAKQGDVGAGDHAGRKGDRRGAVGDRGCELHLENTAGAGGTLGRSFEELAALLEGAGGDRRIGFCLDSCHLFASGYDIRTIEGVTQVLDEFDAVVGLERLRSLHLNDSQTPLGSNRDRHADIGEGEIGQTGCAAFLSEPRFDTLPCVLETPGPNREGPTTEELALCAKLRKRGQAARRRSQTAAA